MQTMLIRNAVKGSTMLLNLGPTIKIANIPAIEIRPWVVFIPKSACRNTSIASSTTTPGTLLSFPKIMLNAVTTKKQNATTKYTLKL